MTHKCNEISLDTASLINDLSKVAVSAMHTEGKKLAEVMRQEVFMTTHGDAPGKPSWRDELRRNIGLVSTVVTQDGITMEIGYVSSGKAEEVRAMVVAYGSGDKAEGGGTKVHAGPPGRNVWDDDLSAKHPSREICI